MEHSDTPTMTRIIIESEDEQLKSARTITTAVYALQAASFLLGITYLVAVTVNYVKKDDVQGTWLASHFRWQIRTFWFSMLWTVLGLLTLLFIVGYFILVATTIWVIYRIVKGWLRLTENKAMYPIP